VTERSNRRLRLAVALGALGIALVTVAPAGSRPAAGISVTATDPFAAIIGAGDPSGVVMAAVVVAAKFSPEALHDEVRVTMFSTKPGGTGAAPFSGRDTGNVLHSTAVYQNAVGVFQGERLFISAKWRAYTPLPSGTIDGTKIASGILEVPKREPAPRLRYETKQNAAQDAQRLYQKCAAYGTLSLAIPGLAGVAAQFCALADRSQQVALDPEDPNFRVVARPKTPPAHKVVAGKGVSPAAAAAINKLLAIQAKEIGLADALVTAINRSQGAHVKKQVEWEKKQVRAAGTYASQYAALILAEAKLSPSVRRAFASPGDVSEEQAFAFQASLINGPLPAGLARALSRLGLTRAELKEVEAQLVVRNHPSLYDGDAFALLADPIHLSIRREMAAGLRAFAKKAAKDPLNTGT
jgi:hypothetical protein